MKKTIFFILVSIVLTASVYAEDYPLGFPSANFKVQNAVSIDLLRKIALDKATETFGQATPGTEIPCCDLNGDIICYIFVFQLGNKPFQSYSRITAGVKEGRRLYEEGMSKIKTGLKNIETGRKKRWGIGEYCTVVVSAREDGFPVLEYSEGLPRYFTAGDLLQQKANDTLGGNAKLQKIYYAGPLDQFYEFGDGSNRILINPFSFETPKYKLMKKNETRTIDPTMENEIKEKWRQLKQKFQ